MTKEEAIILSAYTGYLLVDNFSDVHEFIEKLLGRPVWTHQLADPDLVKEIREKCKPILPTVAKEKPLNDTDVGQSVSMSAEEAIKRINQHMSIHHIGQYPHILIAEALQMAIDALQEKAEREDPKPLTIEELRQMNGEPVWLVDAKRWGIIDIEEYGRWEGVPFVCFSDRGINHVWHIESRRIRLYRNKPKEE